MGSTTISSASIHVARSLTDQLANKRWGHESHLPFGVNGKKPIVPLPDNSNVLTSLDLE